ncbi:beta-xylosidase [Paraburkholderia fynbosensis]|uniref:Beta-xylosidase n=1 Tax=Paraburkholderia fynbosensis TaxID=1200993 RepID=A0A6J5H3X6_9BURK|nr:beta-xylosidase [Paraburkholderia fynbosensis]CAB3810587.1 hypothetical protein LMG27177_07311 [Paraburkholderia fynbosensis]
MTRRSLHHVRPDNFHTPARVFVSARVASLVLGAVMLVASPYGSAQIPQGGGSEQQENRTSAMGATPDPAASMVHESNKPQAKDAGSAPSRGKTGEDHKANGAGGFDNGLYGTGAGSNK